MLDSLKQKQTSAIMVKHFILMNLIYPLYSSQVNSSYSPNIVYANIFAVLFIGLSWLEGNISWKKKSWLGCAVILGLVGFNAFAYYATATQIGDGWYAGQINVTIAFVFFLTWLYGKEDGPCMGEDMVKFLLKAAVITNAIGLIPGVMDCSMIAVGLNGYDFVPAERGLDYSWIYTHKSEYSFMLVLFLGLTVTYRRLFDKKWQFWGSVAVFSAGLVVANTRTTMLAAMFILAGVMLDYFLKKAGGFRWKYLLWFLPVVAVGVVMLYLFAQDKDLTTLGARIPIWKAAVARIRELPWGIGAMCGLQEIPTDLVHFPVWNCHNVFLNCLLQFSVPAGCFYLMMMASILVASIWKNRSFRTLGIWAAMLIPMTMDWCVLTGEVPMMLLALYFLFFSPVRKNPAE